jgi:hypothetical protein
MGGGCEGELKAGSSEREADLSSRNDGSNKSPLFVDRSIGRVGVRSIGRVGERGKASARGMNEQTERQKILFTF